MTQKGYVEPNNPAYQQWINKHVSVDCQQWCLSKADNMAKEFPELRVIGVSSHFGGHAWCINEKNEVVDPTAHQFPHRRSYEGPWLERDEFPRKCMHCGEHIWKDTPGVRAFLGGDDEIHPHTYCIEAWKKEMAEINAEIAKKKEVIT